jgi:hypothetical protein
MIEDSWLPDAKPKRFAKLERVSELSPWTNDVVFTPVKYDNVHYELDDLTGRYREVSRTRVEHFL